MKLRFSADDIRRVKAEYGLTCGFCKPVALAAISGRTLDDVMRVAIGGEIATVTMRTALCRLRLPFRGCGVSIPKHGLMIIEWDGPPSHWICVSGDKLLDNHTVLSGRGWVSTGEWSRMVRRKTGVVIKEAIEVG